MRCFLSVSALSLLAAPLAAAQPAAAPGDEVIDLDAPERRAPAPPEEAAPPAREGASQDEALRRPVGTTVGIGIGYILPSDVLEPETASVRLRFPGGITLAPRVEVGTNLSSSEFLGTESDDSELFVTLGTELRAPLASRGELDFLVVGGAALSYVGTDPDGADNGSSVTSLGLSWGIALDYWLSERWALSATASNPLLAYTRTSREQPGGDSNTSTFQVSATFDPAVRIMGHLFF